MNFKRTQIDAIGYELAPVVVTSTEIEQRLAPLYEALHMAPGQIESLTGIVERRYWEEGVPLSEGAIKAARQALATSPVKVDEIGTVIYAGVCRENFEPATAFAVAAGLGIGPRCEIYDISNACLGVLSGIADVANRIELGQIRAGLVVACETAREINEIAIERMLEEKDMSVYTRTLATLTGGSGAAAVLLTDGSFSENKGRKLRASVTRSAPEHHQLCTWGLRETGPHQLRQFMQTDAFEYLQQNPEMASNLANSDFANLLANTDFANAMANGDFANAMANGDFANAMANGDFANAMANGDFANSFANAMATAP